MQTKNIPVQTDSPTLCAIPWNHLVIQQDGNFRACCQCIRHPYGLLKDDQNNTMNILSHTINEARNSNVLKDIRKAMINGEKPEVCNLCWDEEKIGIVSRRLNVNTMFDKPDISKTSEDGSIDTESYPLEYMDLRFGNLCNQACRSCGPTESSLWYEEVAETQKQFNFYNLKTYNFKSKGSAIAIDSDDFLWYHKPNFETEFRKNLQSIKRLYFTGGEPTINKAHFNTLQICIDEGVAHNIALDYNSNLMSVPDHLLEKWSHFPTVNIGASIDAYGDLANYVRYPSQWETIEKNIFYLDNYTFTNNFHFGISSTISILNILNFIDLNEWMLDKNFKILMRTPTYHMLNGPTYLNVQILPIKTKDMIFKKYNDFFDKLKQKNGEYDSLISYYTNIISFMYEKDEDVNELKRFFDKMSKSDQFRKQDLFSYIPWIKDTWEYVNEQK